MTGSGKTAAFLLPILHQLIDRPRGTTRALVLTPTRELAAQILEDLNDLAVHTPLTAAAVFGGVGMGRRSTRSAAASTSSSRTPGRLLDHFRAPYAKLAGLEYPRARRSRSHARHGLPARHPPRAAPLPDEAADAVLQRDDAAADRGAGARDAARSRDDQPRAARRRRRSGITQAVYPVRAAAEAALLLDAAAPRRRAGRAGLHPDEASRQSAGARSRRRSGVDVERIHGNRSQAQRTEALEGFKSGQVQGAGRDRHRRARHRRRRRSATSSTSTCRGSPRTYIHRVGRTARAEMTGDAFTLVCARRGERPARDRAGDRQAPAARDDSPTSTTARAVAERLRGAACAAHRARSARARPEERARAGSTPSGARRTAASVRRKVQRQRTGRRRVTAADGRRRHGGPGRPAIRRCFTFIYWLEYVLLYWTMMHVATAVLRIILLEPERTRLINEK